MKVRVGSLAAISSRTAGNNRFPQFAGTLRSEFKSMATDTNERVDANLRAINNGTLVRPCSMLWPRELAFLDGQCSNPDCTGTLRSYQSDASCHSGSRSDSVHDVASPNLASFKGTKASVLIWILHVTKKLISDWIVPGAGSSARRMAGAFSNARHNPTSCLHEKVLAYDDMSHRVLPSTKGLQWAPASAAKHIPVFSLNYCTNRVPHRNHEHRPAGVFGWVADTFGPTAS